MNEEKLNNENNDDEKKSHQGEDLNENYSSQKDEQKENSSQLNILSEEKQESLKLSEEEELVPKISPLKAGIIGLAGGFIFYQIFGSLLMLLVFGTDLQNADINALRLMNIAGEILFILLPALIFSKLIYENVTKVIRFRNAPWQEYLLFTLGMIVLIPLLQNLLSIQNFYFDMWSKDVKVLNDIKVFLDEMSKMVESTYGNLLSINSFLDAIIVILAVSVVPAICEETMFRGFIQKSFELRYKKIMGAFITAIFFGIYHFNPYALIPLIVLGFYFGYAVIKTNSIFVSMTLHFINNFSAIILYLIFGDDELVQNPSLNPNELQSAFFNLIFEIIIFIVIMFLISLYYKRYKLQKASINN
ncbi:MAG: hypothetical protein STSR0008_14900 [Ignavibacterium sp.]